MKLFTEKNVKLRHCERSEAIQNASTDWIATLSSLARDDGKVIL